MRILYVIRLEQPYTCLLGIVIYCTHACIGSTVHVHACTSVQHSAAAYSTTHDCTAVGFNRSVLVQVLLSSDVCEVVGIVLPDTTVPYW
jgi:hypothetical protein